MNTLNKAKQTTAHFSPAARWIWPSPGFAVGWWMFRKTFSTAGLSVASAQLKITSALHHIVFLNGTLISRGPGNAYNFSKVYDEIEVAPFLNPGGDNVLAVLAVEVDQGNPSFPSQFPKSGLLAELVVTAKNGATQTISSDASWRVKRHLSFAADTPTVFIVPGQDEVFDARSEELGWTLASHDDAAWSAVGEVGPVGTPPWTDMEKNTRGLLTNDPVYPVRFNAIELARLREGYHLRLSHPAQGSPCYFTEVTASHDATIRLWGVGKAALNGREIGLRVPLDPSNHGGVSESETVAVPAGTHLLAIGNPGREFDIETSATLEFSAANLLKGEAAQWACIPIIPKSVSEYGWNVPPGIPVAEDVEELPRLLAVPDAAAFSDSDRSRIEPVGVKAPSVKSLVSGQTFYRVPGGHSDPSIHKPQPRHELDSPAIMPLLDSHRLLHADVEATTILPQEGYDVHFVVDFDRLVLGYIAMELDAPEGTIVDVTGFEVIDGKGIYWIREYNTFRYICREGPQEFVSNCRRGFRYLSVTIRNFTRPVRFRNLRCYHTAFPRREVGGFECSDELLNRIHRMSVDTAALCMVDTYISCPGWEQSVWVGDTMVTGQISHLHFGGYEMDHHFVRLIGQSVTRPEWLRDYRPPSHPKYEKFHSGKYVTIPCFPDAGCEIPIWSSLWIIQAWQLWLYAGNHEHLEENFGYVAQTLENFRKLTNERGLLDVPGAHNLMDWGNNDLAPYGEATMNNAFLVHTLRLAANMARALGRESLAADYEAEVETRVAAINRHCWDAERNAYVDTVRDEWAYKKYAAWCRSNGDEPFPYETYLSYGRISEQSNTLALMCGCVPPERQAAVLAIVERVKNGRYVAGGPFLRTAGAPPESEAPDGIVAVGTPWFLFFTFQTLLALGKADLVLEIIRRDWGEMVKCGSRTCWETFKRGDRWTTSICHAWSAAPAVYHLTHILGIRPVDPGYRTFVIDPQPVDLEWARGSVATPHGPIYVSWSKNPDGQLEIECSAPPECKRV